MTINLSKESVSVYQPLSRLFIVKYPRTFINLKDYTNNYSQFKGWFEQLTKSDGNPNPNYLDIYYLPIINRNIANLIFPLANVTTSNLGGIKTIGNVINIECNLQVGSSINSASFTIKNPYQYYWLDGDKKNRCVFEPEDIVVIQLPGKDDKLYFAFVGFIDTIKTQKNKDTGEWLLNVDCEGTTRKLKKTRTVISPGVITFKDLGNDAKKALTFSQYISKVNTYTIPFSYIMTPKSEDSPRDKELQKQIKSVNDDIIKYKKLLDDENKKQFKITGLVNMYTNQYNLKVAEKTALEKELSESQNSKIGFNMLDILTEIIIRTYSIDATYLLYLDVYTEIIKRIGKDYKTIDGLDQKLADLNKQKKVLEDKVDSSKLSFVDDNVINIYDVTNADTELPISQVLLNYKDVILGSTLVNSGNVEKWEKLFTKTGSISAELTFVNSLIEDLNRFKDPSKIVEMDYINLNYRIEIYLHERLNDYRVQMTTSAITSSGYAIYTLPISQRSEDDIPICFIVATDQPPFQIAFNNSVNFFTSEFKENHVLVQEIATSIDYEFYENETGVLFIKPVGVEYLTPDLDSAYQLTKSDILKIDTIHDISNLYTGIIIKGNTTVDISLDPEEWGNIKQYEDLRTINKYGYIGYAPEKQVVGLIGEEGCRLYGIVLLQRNNRKNEFKSNISLDRGDARLLIGNWVWIEELNEIYYLESVQHSWTPVEYSMSLTLHTRRIPLLQFKVSYDKKKVSSYIPGELKNDVVVALNKEYYDSITVDSFSKLTDQEIFDLLYFNNYIWEPMNLLDYKKIINLATVGEYKASFELQSKLQSKLQSIVLGGSIDRSSFVGGVGSPQVLSNPIIR